MDSSRKITRKSLFVTGTDTGVGKTIITLGIASLLKNRGIDAVAMKPVQCGGDDAQLLKKELGLKDPIDLINPFFAKAALAPQVAFNRVKKNIDISKIISAYKQLRERHEVVIVEGAGGLLVPLKENYLISDLIRDLKLSVIVVSRLGLGTINHILLTVKQAQDLGIEVLGIILNNVDKRNGIAEKTNPDIVSGLTNVPVLGVMPYLPKISPKAVMEKMNLINLNPIFEKRDSLTTKKLVKLDKRYIWHPFTQMKDWLKEEPIIIEEAKGNYLKDTDGRWYLDGISSLWVNVHGHRNKEIDSAVKRQLEMVSHSTLLGLGNVPSIRLAEELIKIAPRGLAKVFYSDNGSTAVEVAIKIASQYWQNMGKPRKKRFVYLNNSYHGDTIGSVSVGGIDLFHKIYRPLLFDAIKVSAPYCYRCPKEKSYPGCEFECLDELKAVLKKNNKTISALVVEPIVQAAGGIIIWPKGVLKCMRKLSQRYNVLLIVDEVATGFGRTGKMFACQLEAVSPDIMCLAKGISGGYLPLAATLVTQKIYNSFLADYKEKKTFFHGHTYTGNPLASAASLASIKIFKKEKTLESMAPKIALLKNGLKRFLALKHVGDLRQKGFMMGIELVKDKSTKQPYLWEEKIGIKVCQQVRKHSLILRPLGNVIVLMPPLSIENNQLEDMLDITYQAIKKITEIDNDE